MFDKEILGIKNELTALKASRRRTVTNSALFMESASLTLNCEPDYPHFYDRAIATIQYESDNPPILMTCWDRVSGAQLWFLEEFLSIDKEKKCVYSRLHINDYLGSSEHKAPVTIFCHVYSLSPIKLKLEAQHVE